MGTKEALNIIDRALAMVQADRATHVTIQTAFETIKAAVEPKKKPKMDVIVD